MSKQNYGAGKLLLALATVITLSSASYATVPVSAEVAQASTNFTDIKGHWAETSIRKAAELGLVEGYTDGTYKPGANVTRAEFAAMLSRATKYKANKVSQAFSDVPPTNWAAEAVNKVTALGFVNRVDYPNGFVGNKAMTRIELAKWMANGLAAADSEYNKAQGDAKGDKALIPVQEFFKGTLKKSDYPFVTIAMGTGIMTGDAAGKFNVDAPTTRAEVATILLRYMEAEGKKATDFYGLNELREVAKTGTNFNTFGKMKMAAPDASQYKNVNEAFGKSLKLRSDVATVTMSKMIFVDPYPADGKKSVYAPMFHSDADPISKTLYQERYRIFTEYSFTSKVDNLSRLGTLADTGLSIQIGLPIFNANIDKYGANYYTRDERSPKSYNKGQGEKDMWAATYSTKSADDGLAQMYTEDGKMINIRVNK
ncbi:S-layer homology domain-containing protein [Paenibacillus polymyxa]|uniref:S-layer homology domain-containing protein n=1 Tax=Paenibacillus polymyxa TaxID=1406 RepID=UPI001BE8B7B9|nr:S-layer homology domain-containing protein [Paenibacillus polymyxa]MBT2284260.1 S-layer homology domain-containing protein [Paenibacillus polymyxa]